MDYARLTREQLIAQLEERDEDERGGIRLTYKGQTPPWRMVRRVRPRRQKIEADLSFGDEAEQDCNLILEGENLQGLVSLYKYRGQVDLVLTDPPYNTGRDFRYNDKWDEDPNDPDLGKLVADEDGSKHSKWLRFMEPRLWMMREMLRPNGVLAICIDHRELFRMGLLLDGLFGEENRLAVINWQKTTSKNNTRRVSQVTEYILVYAKSVEIAKTGLLERSLKADARFSNVDGDPLGDWRVGADLSAPGGSTHPTMIYQIQSPFTGILHPPPEGRCWGMEKSRIKQYLEEWGVDYAEREVGDGRKKALILKGATIRDGKGVPDDPIVKRAQSIVEERFRLGKLKIQPFPRLYFGTRDGSASPKVKVYKEEVMAGSVPSSFWVEEEEEPIELGPVSWLATESGRNREGIEELNEIVGRGHGFDTVKPMKLFRKIIQIWCPVTGLVLDPFAGSGTTAHAVLELNKETDASRRFVLIEQGRPNKRDDYARTLTAVRVRHAVSGERVTNKEKLAILADPLPGGFRFSRLTHLVDSEAVLALEREEMIDLLVTSHWDQGDRGTSFLRRLPAGTEKHLFGVDGNRRGYFLVWDGPEAQNRLNRAVFKEIVTEAKAHHLNAPFHVYARLNSYDGPNVEFYQIPDRILEKLGVNTSIEPFMTGKTAEESAA
jgi:adenine-specific DNA-methyltransferase